MCNNLFVIVNMAERVNFFKENAKNKNTTKATTVVLGTIIVMLL